MNAIDLGRLLGYACNPAATPGRSGGGAEYTRLIVRYLSDDTFRLLFDDVLEGVGCQVADASQDTGMIVLAAPDSPWCWPPAGNQLPWNKQSYGPEHRAARMLVVLALLAYIAPTAADLEDLLTDPTRLPPQLTAGQLEQFIREFAEQCEQTRGNPSGAERPMWWHWLQFAQLQQTPTGRSSTTYLVNEVLVFLNEQSLISRNPGKTARDTQFRPRRRLLAHYRDLLVDELFTDLQTFSADYDSHDHTDTDTDTDTDGAS